MSKVSLGKSTDPRQQQLREEKAAFNKEMSGFITNLIAFKKLMNGHPNKFYMQKSKINDEIPSNPAAIVSELVSNFNDLAQKGNEIILEQIEYSKTRRKPITASEEIELVVEASNKLTRFLSRYKGPYFGNPLEKKRKKYRIKLLGMFEDLYYMFKQLESNVLNDDKESLIANSKIIQKINITFDQIARQVSYIIEDLKIQQKNTVDTISGDQVQEPISLKTDEDVTEPKEDAKIDIPELVEDDSKKNEGIETKDIPILQEYVSEFIKRYNITMNRGEPELKDAYLLNKYNPLLEKEIHVWTATANTVNKNVKKILPLIILFIEALPAFTDKRFSTLFEYNALQFLPSLKEDFEKDDSIGYKSAKDFYDFKYKKFKDLYPKKAFRLSELEKFADGIIEKQLKLLKHKLPLLRSDNSVNRLNVYENSKKIREKIDLVLDQLEDKDFSDFESLFLFKDSIKLELELIKNDLKLLGVEGNIDVSPVDYDRLVKLLKNPTMYEDLKGFSKDKIEKEQELENKRRLRSIIRS